MLKYILLSLAFASQAFAGNSGTIYTYGYFEFVVDTLSALSGVVATNNDFLMKIAVAFALFAFFLKNINMKTTGSMIGFEMTKFVIVVSLIKGMFLYAPDDDAHAFAVVDKITSATQEVRQVPKGLGEILVLTTNLEDAILAKMETFFSTPSSTSYRNAGLGFNLTAPMEIFQSTIINNNLRKTLETYIENCKIMGDWADGTQDKAEIFNSANLKADLATTQTLLTVSYLADPQGTVVSCAAAWGAISPAITTEATGLMTIIANQKGMSAGVFSAKAEDALSYMIGSGKSGNAALEEAILRNSTLESLQKISASVGLSGDQLVRNKSIAEMSMSNEAVLSNVEAQGLIPVMKAVCLAFVISLSWLFGLDVAIQRFIVDVWLGKVFKSCKIRGTYAERPNKTRGEKCDTFAIIDESKLIAGTSREKNDPYSYLNRTATEARGFGFGLIVAAQSAEHFPPEFLKNFDAQVILNTGIADFDAVRKSFGVDKQFLEFTQHGYGNALIKTGKSFSKVKLEYR